VTGWLVEICATEPCTKAGFMAVVVVIGWRLIAGAIVIVSDGLTPLTNPI